MFFIARKGLRVEFIAHQKEWRGNKRGGERREGEEVKQVGEKEEQEERRTKNAHYILTDLILW